MTNPRYKKYYNENRENRINDAIAYSKSPKGKEVSKKYNLKQKMSVYDILGMKCVKCGFDDIRALQIDHVNGGGNREIKVVKINKYRFIFAKLIAGSKDYQVLCANCNWIKRVENNER